MGGPYNEPCHYPRDLKLDRYVPERPMWRKIELWRIENHRIIGVTRLSPWNGRVSHYGTGHGRTWEGGSGKGVIAFTPLSTPAERLKAVKIDFEKGRTRTKQAKVNASWMKAAKKKSIKAFGSWVIDNNQPFTVVDSIYTNPLLDTIREVGRDVRAPSAYELAKIYLPKACQEIKQWISRFANMWQERVLTIMCDG